MVSAPPEKAMYVAPRSDWDWLRSVRRKLYQRSLDNPNYVFRKLWGLLMDPRNLRVALARVARNRGRRTAGVDGVTVRKVLHKGTDRFVDALRTEIRTGAYRPSPVRRVLIPKSGQPGKFRPLGIPTVKDRVVQAAVKNILEPIFEADFFPCSYGFRPGKSVHGALEHLRLLLRPTVRGARAEVGRRLPYQWAIEGDIKGCFDNIGHHGLMERIRRRVGDAKVCRLIVAFLKAGILSESQFLRTDSGTPQGGILSPLLANIALSVIEERYARHVWPHRTLPPGTASKEIARRAATARAIDRRRRPLLYPIRYADDFIILVSAPHGPSEEEAAKRIAEQEKADLATALRDTLHLELSEAKTLVTSVTKPMRFLGHHVRVRVHPMYHRMTSSTVIPKDRSQRLRSTIKGLFRGRTVNRSLQDRLKLLNPLLRGWGHFYRHASYAKKVFAAIDAYAWRTILGWLKKKHRSSIRGLIARYGFKQPHRRSIHWREGGQTLFQLATLRTEPFKLGWMRTPDFA
jgi:group II intron reverse transcriptase/maturase